MRNEQDKIAPEMEQVDPEAVLSKEISRAMEMMKRVKAHRVTAADVLPEDQRMPSYFIPESSFFCPLTG